MCIGTKWQCSRCGTLLGVWQRKGLHLQYKKAQFLVEGKVVAVCRKCSAINEIDSDRPQERVAPR